MAMALLLVAGNAAALEKVYGKGVSAADTVLVSQVLSNPDTFVDKVVRVEGTAVSVCKHRGCWVELASDQEGETIRIKVQDGVIVFPAEIVGEQVMAEGVFTANQLDLETSKKVCAYEAEKAGEDFDPENVTQCVTLYQVTGTGAVVKDKPAKEVTEGDA
jgi:hypothetical protein